MTNILDSKEAIKKIDTVNVAGSIEQLGNQCQQAWNDVEKIHFPENYKKIDKIVFSGMGGSALNAYTVKSLFFDQLKVPFEIVNEYHLPPYVNEHTLVILCSYSGTTEETLSCANEALTKKACITGLTTGAKLGEFLTANQFPAYIFTPKFNPSNQPRLGTGYSIYGLIAILTKLNLISVTETDLAATLAILTNGNKQYDVSVNSSNNIAKQIAQKWFEKIPIIITAEFLTNVGRVIRNQFNENSKTYAAFHEIPELNHHLLEGLKNPAENKKILRFLFINSLLYSAKISKRMSITKDVVVKNGIPIEEFKPKSTNKIAQAFECIQFGAYINYYLAILYGIDPAPIPWVDYFKKQLAS